MEIWREVPGFIGYEVSSHGAVRSKDRMVNSGAAGRCIRRGIMLKQQPDKDGYLHVTFSHEGKITRRSVHRVVAMTFIDVVAPSFVVNHKDFNKTNNTPENLEYVTQKENVKHSNDAGRRRKYTENMRVNSTGRANPNRAKKINAQIADAILADRASGMKLKELAKKYALSTATVHSICSGAIWVK